MSGGRNRFERYGPDEPFDDRTGNGIVNNGPDSDPNGLQGARGFDDLVRKLNAAPAGAGERRSGEGPTGDGPTGDVPTGDGLRDEGLRDEELALRELLHGAVGGLTPSDGALDHLRRAVPERRARKRQALVGVAAAALLIGTAIPAFVHVARSSTGDQARSVNAGHGQEHAEEEAEREKRRQVEEAEANTAGPAAGSSGRPRDPGNVSRSPGQRPDAKGDTQGATGGGTEEDAPGEAPSTSAVCDPGQLGVTSAHADKPDAEGKVYGVFRISNVSGTTCTVGGAGSFGFSALGAADPTKITVVEHTAGDAASGLPDPSRESLALPLAPDSAYEVRFAWVPSETCPVGGASPSPPAPTEGGGGAPTGGGDGGTGTVPEDNTTAQLVTEDGALQDGSISVTHTAEAGAPSAEATIPNACSGTIYRTGVLGV
ncbi:hypothetical protein [Streptomyces sp. NPDC020965]|uniref:hypothetical protein n=1 Tax=Streptomyces sp. NPDC020965 TaxID=3365105 RepID=UPI0037AA5DD8